MTCQLTTHLKSSSTPPYSLFRMLHTFAFGWAAGGWGMPGGTAQTTFQRSVGKTLDFVSGVNVAVVFIFKQATYN